MKHYAKEELDLYRNHEMSVLGRIQCGAHLEHCTECRKRLEELKADDAFLAELRESLRNFPDHPMPSQSESLRSRG